jgi:pimeloyl-ACP methyl ester carboxylesterase
MRPALNLIASVMLALSSALTLGSPEDENNWVWSTASLVSGRVRGGVKAEPTTASRPALRTSFQFEPIGLSLLDPYTRGKIPAVFVHGLGNTPASWTRMIECLEADPAIRDHYQFWTFGFSTGEPILYSASLLRQALTDARERYDPGRTDKAFDRMVLIGYSMGGILAKAMAGESQSTLWDEISSRSFETLQGPEEAREVLQRSFFFKAVPEVSRVICIATPHRGSQVDQGALHWLASRLNRPMDRLRKIHESLVASNDPEFFHNSFQEKLQSSVDQLAWEHPRLKALLKLAVSPRVQFHSIIADLSDPPGAGGTDGFVPYASSHLDGASSERIVHGGHLCQANPLVIDETDRILTENLASSVHGRAAPLGAAGAVGPAAGTCAGLGSRAINGSCDACEVTH